MLPVAEWCSHSGDEVQRVVAAMEKVVVKRSGRLAVSVFRCLDAMYHKDDFTELTTMMLNEDQKPTASRLKQVAESLIRRRHWSWLLQHPELDSGHIHESRRMFLCPVAPCCMVSEVTA